MPTFERSTLTEGWEFKQVTGDSSLSTWTSVRRVPTVVHLDLLDHKHINDPFLDLNELEVEWVGEETWAYRRSIDVPKLAPGSKAVLVFEGLDTFAEIRLNGHKILKSDNMFLEYRVDITSSVQLGQQNELEIIFEPALIRGRELVKAHPEHRFLLFNGEPGRLAVRKAQYHWGWDWGPILMTAGPWKPVHLEIYDSRIVDTWAPYELNSSRDLAIVNAIAEIDCKSPSRVRFTIRLRGEVIACSVIAVDENGHAQDTFELHCPELWYPHGYGSQPLYELETTLLVEETQVSTQTKRVAFRTAELVQTEDHIGESFYFKINGVDVFCGGSCWIPADNFLSRISDETYRNWLQLMVDANQVMVRIWGGGIYESPVFYDTCDELGILVWQDFMFGCGSYPTWPALLESIREEAIHNVRQLRHHPSLVIWTGNNEDYQVQQQYGLDYDVDDKDPDSWLRSNFPARYIYEKLLPDVIRDVAAKDTVYWPSSPFSRGKDIGDLTIGDVHQWNIWHGSQAMYQTFDKLIGRFISELGMEGFPSLRTIKGFANKESELYPQSRTLDFHNKADGHERRIAVYLVENFRNATDLKTYIYLTQLLQSEALMYAYRASRRRWKSRGCGGILVWQLNDCWPTISWSIVDYHLRPKAAYYSTARSMKPMAIGVSRQHHDWTVTHARPAKTQTFDVWIASSRSKDITGNVEISFISIDSGLQIKDSIVKKDVVVKANDATEMFHGTVNNVEEEPHCIAVRLIVDGETVSRDVDWPQPFKYLSFENRQLEVTRKTKELVFTCSKPVKGLILEAEDGVKFSDNCIDVVPGDAQHIFLSGEHASAESVTFMYYGQEDSQDGAC